MQFENCPYSCGCGLKTHENFKRKYHFARKYENLPIFLCMGFRIPDSGFREIFACGIQNPGIWNPVNQPRPQGFSLKKMGGAGKGTFPRPIFKGKALRTRLTEYSSKNAEPY